MNIWKVSHGDNVGFRPGEREDLLRRRVVTVGGNFGSGRNSTAAFQNEMAAGDIVFVCWAGEVKALGVLKRGPVGTATDGSGWIERGYRLLEDAARIGRYRGGRRHWEPSAQTTLFPVPVDCLGDFHGAILTPYFGWSLAQLEKEFRRGEAVQEEDDELEFPEGKLAWRRHRGRERQSGIAKAAKERAWRRDGRLFCRACKTDFEATYGAHGRGFIECHHVRPISSLRATGGKTKLKDIVLLCSNCHRMVHRRRPWLSMGELRSLVRNRRP